MSLEKGLSLMTTSRLASSRSILHYDPERIDYAVTESELHQLEQAGNTTWKEVCLMSASAFLGFASNALGGFAAQDAFKLTVGLFFNSTIAVISFFSAIAFGVAWKRAALSRRRILDHIRNKPRVILRAESLEFENNEGNDAAKILLAGEAKHA